MVYDKILRRNNIHYYFDKNNTPVISIKPSEILKIETERADGMYLTKENPFFNSHEEVMSKGPNPVTGPIYVEGAKPGDVLCVMIEDITPCPDGSPGYVTYVPGQGGLINPFSLNNDLKPSTTWCELKEGKFMFSVNHKDIELAVKPFIGTIGVSQGEERRASYWNGQDFAGNLDCPSLTIGSTVVMPVNVEGALLSIGDVHARQGHGEIVGCAVVCRGDVVIRTHVLSKNEAKYYKWPQVNGNDFIGSIGCIMNSMEKSIQAAVYDLLKRLEYFYGFEVMEAYKLLGQCLELEICQMSYPFCSCLARISKKYI